MSLYNVNALFTLRLIIPRGLIFPKIIINNNQFIIRMCLYVFIIIAFLVLSVRQLIPSLVSINSN